MLTEFLMTDDFFLAIYTVYLPDQLQSIAIEKDRCSSLKCNTMILDKLENADLYSVMSKNLKKGFEYLKNTDFSSLEVGRYEIDGKEVFAFVS